MRSIPAWGFEQCTRCCAPEGIGRDAFIALGLQEGFRLKNIDKQTRTTYSVKSSRYRNLLGGKEFDGINQLWSSDITYFFCLEQFFYIVFIMDVYSRRIIGYNIADNMRAVNNLSALKMALELRNIDHYKQRLIHHSDKGTQYASDDYIELLEQRGIQISMCNEVYENTHIERINDTIKNQYLKRMEIKSNKQLAQKLNEAIKAYNESRPHQSLNRMSPVQYEKHLLSEQGKNRKKMTIFTIKPNENGKFDTQLNLFESL